MKQFTLLTALIVLVCSLMVSAEVKLPALIGDHMVLQRDTTVKVWGWADPGEEVKVSASWPGHPQARTITNDQGQWQLELTTAPAGGPYQITVAGHNRIKIDDVLLGEVWLGSGQSNMMLKVKACDNAAAEIQQADFPRIRLFAVPLKYHNVPQDNVDASWQLCSPQTVPDFSATLYYFGRYLHQQLNVPIGLIRSAWGGTVIEAWISRDGLKEFPEFNNSIQKIQGVDTKTLYAKENKKLYHQNVPTMLYNAMISPLLNYRIAGVTWYQGESNRRRPQQYLKLMSAWINNWREKWANPDLPFYYVQIAPFRYDGEDVAGSAYLREAQMLSMSIPNVGMAVTMDIGLAKNIHPTNKQEVGRRLALWALAKTYGRQDQVCSGPIYTHMKIEKNQIRLFFDYAQDGLVAKGGPLNSFTIAGPDHVFVPAEAKIEGSQVVVSSPQVKDPRAVRFAFTNWAQPNFYNKAGLPASSFRTDRWDELPGQ